MANIAAQIPEVTANNIHEQLVEIGSQEFTSITTFPAHWLYEGEQRLDGGYYTNEAFNAVRIVRDCGFEVQKMEQVAQDVFILGRFRRIYASDKTAGWPYLSASEALTFRPVSDRCIAKDHAPRKAKSHFAKQGWILVSCSGTIGRSVLATRRMEGSGS